MASADEGRSRETPIRGNDDEQSIAHDYTQSLSGPNILNIYENISPESVGRILKLVEREQSREKTAAKAEIGILIVALIVLITLLGTLVGSIVFIWTTVQKDTGGIAVAATLGGVVGGVLGGAVITAATVYYAWKLRAHHTAGAPKGKTPDD